MCKILDYSKILSFLLNVSGYKLKDIANLIHYDISYISKWANGHKLPNLESSLAINRALANAFSTAIHNKGIEDEIEDFLIPKLNPKSLKVLKKCLYNALYTSYFTTLYERDPKKIFPKDESGVITGYDNIVDFIYPITCLFPKSESLSIYSTVNNDFLKRIFTIDDDLIIFYRQNMVSLNFFINDMANFLKFDSTVNAMSFLSKTTLYDINAYQSNLLTDSYS